MKDPSKLRPEDLCAPTDQQITRIVESWLMPLPFIKLEEEPKLRPPPEEWRKEMLNLALDGYANFPIPRPKSKEEEQEIVRKFIDGIKKLFTVEDNWTQIKPLLTIIDFCARCQTCAEVCQIFLAGGKKHEYYRPTFKTEILRMLYDKYVRGKKDVPIEVNVHLIARLYELSYRCTVCRRCFQFCPLGLDQGVVTRELRKVFSQQFSWAPKELHELGTIQQLRIGSSTGTSPKAMLSMVKFMEEEIYEKTGKRIKIPVDEKGADILIIHNYGEFLSWIENPEAFAIIFEEAGLSWTLASIPPGYDAVNYGLYYDDIQLDFCCGAGGAFAIMYGYNFPDWKYKVAGRMKVKQTLEAFADCIDPKTPKYLCAPCSNCKGMIRDTFAYYKLWERFRILYGGLVELIVNAMVDLPKPFIEWTWR
ncbi:MAG: hypothetical protein B6V02_00610 [Thermoprotei archaeon ex4572_64]|nr:MAG: hypothetical protein B6V02_00610 [Thermoprotei archaeon ex4572_64]